NESQGPGVYSLTFTVSDNYNGTGGPPTDTKSITITVNEVNIAPILQPISNKQVDEQTTLTVNPVASDPDIPVQTLTYSGTSLPAGATINPNTGAFTWTPTEVQGPAAYNITYNVSDGVATTTQVFTVVVNEVNVVPTLIDGGNKTVTLGQTLSFTVTATDPDVPIQ